MKKLLLLLTATAAIAASAQHQSFRYRATYIYPHYQRNTVQYSHRPGKLRFRGTKIVVRRKQYELYQISDSMVVGIDSLQMIYFFK